MSTAPNINPATALRSPIKRRASVAALRDKLLGSVSYPALFRGMDAQRVLDAARAHTANVKK